MYPLKLAALPKLGPEMKKHYSQLTIILELYLDKIRTETIA